MKLDITFISGFKAHEKNRFLRFAAKKNASFRPHKKLSKYYKQAKKRAKKHEKNEKCDIVRIFFCLLLFSSLTCFHCFLNLSFSLCITLFVLALAMISFLFHSPSPLFTFFIIFFFLQKNLSLL